MDQPTLTPGSNGYQSLQSVPNYGSNPWSGMIAGDTATATAQTTAATAAVGGAQTQMTNYQNATAAYPTYPNPSGLGSQNAYSTPAPAAPTPATPTIQSDGSLGTTTSSGFNPWSLKGEALAR